MRYLLDTHVFIWLVSMTGRLRPPAQALISDPANTLYVSAATAWEMSIKYGKGKLTLPVPPELYIPSRMALHSLSPLAIEHRHATAVAHLPHHHGDPFDRLLIAQAIIEDIPLITADTSLDRYPVRTIPA